MPQEPTQTEILQVVSSYAEYLDSQDKGVATLTKPVAPPIAARLKQKGTRRRLSPSSRAVSGTVWAAWGIVLTAFIYVSHVHPSSYIIAFAVLFYGVYQLLGSLLGSAATRQPTSTSQND
jgi:hypothetical protein